MIDSSAADNRPSSLRRTPGCPTARARSGVRPCPHPPIPVPVSKTTLTVGSNPQKFSPIPHPVVLDTSRSSGDVTVGWLRHDHRHRRPPAQLRRRGGRGPGAGQRSGQLGRSGERRAGRWLFWLAYRVRRPLDAGRGVSVVVARSADGVQFEPVTEVGRDDLRRRVVRAAGDHPQARRRLAALSSAAPRRTPSTGGSRPSTPTTRPGLADGRRTVVLPGSDTLGGQGPGDHGRGRPAGGCGSAATRSTEPGQEDRMTTRYATSADGLRWQRPG